MVVSVSNTANTDPIEKWKLRNNSKRHEDEIQGEGKFFVMRVHSGQHEPARSETKEKL
jgi:hypothetical protein